MIEDKKIVLHLNWWGGLGDCILYLSAVNCFCLHNKKINVGAPAEYIEKKMMDLIDLYGKDNKILFNYIKREIYISKEGKENHASFKIHPNDNYDWPFAEKGMFISNQIVGTHRVLKINGEIGSIPHYPLKYLDYFPEKKQERKVIMHLNGYSSGGAFDSYFLSHTDLIQMCEMLYDLKLKVVLYTEDNEYKKIMDEHKREFPNVHVIQDKDVPLKDFFEEIGSSICHIGVDSGPAHVALSCGVPLISFKKKNYWGAGLGLHWNDFVMHPLDNTRKGFIYEFKEKIQELCHIYETQKEVRRRIITDPDIHAIDLKDWKKKLDVILKYSSFNNGIYLE